MSDRYLWVIGGGSLQKYIIDEAHAMGLKVVVTDGNKDCECAGMADAFFHVDIFDTHKHLQLAKNLNLEIAGVLAAGIDANVTASVLDYYYEFERTAPVEVAALLHNKADMRKAMRQMGYDVPIFTVVDSRWDAMNKMHKFPGAFVVKPLDNSGGRGQTRLGIGATMEDVATAYEKAARANKGGGIEVLMESLWEGTEHTVETLWWKGEMLPCFITDRKFGIPDGGSYCIELSLINPTKLTPWQQRISFNLARRLGNDLGIENGALKLDLLMDETGPKVIEATTRLSGGWDFSVVNLSSTGMRVGAAAIAIAIGEDPTEYLEKKWDRFTFSFSMFPKQGKKIVKIDDIEARKIPGVEMIAWRYGVGDIVPEYIDSACRVNFIIVSGKDYWEALGNVTAVCRAIVLEVE